MGRHRFIMTIYDNVVYLYTASTRWGHSDLRHGQCFFFSRNIGLVTPRIGYFYYQTEYFLDQRIHKIFYLILKTEALAMGLYGKPGKRLKHLKPVGGKMKGFENLGNRGGLITIQFVLEQTDRQYPRLPL